MVAFAWEARAAESKFKVSLGYMDPCYSVVTHKDVCVTQANTGAKVLDGQEQDQNPPVP